MTLEQLLGLGEKAGSGFQKILRAWDEQHWLQPVVTEELGLEMMQTTLTVNPENEPGEKLGETRAALLAAMAENPRVSVSKLASLLGLSTTAIENNIRQLKALGYLNRHGPAKGGHWEALR